MRTEAAIDAIELLKQDHRTVNQLFRRYEDLGPGNEDEQTRLIDQISEELTIHTNIEETAFYPAVRDLLPEGDRLADEAERKHQEVRESLAELQDLEPGMARFDATVSTLISAVQHHVNEEENEIFPKVRAAVGESQLLELGRRMRRAKEEELGEPILSVGEEEVVVSLFEPVEPIVAEPVPVRRATRRPAKARTAKRPTGKRTARRPAKKATRKRTTAKRAAAKKSTAKRGTRKKATRKSTAKRAAAGKSTRKSTRKSTKRATTRKASAKRSTSRKTGTRKSVRRATGRRRA